jgi:hypothetical protein
MLNVLIAKLTLIIVCALLKVKPIVFIVKTPDEMLDLLAALDASDIEWQSAAEPEIPAWHHPGRNSITICTYKVKGGIFKLIEICAHEARHSWQHTHDVFSILDAILIQVLPYTMRPNEKDAYKYGYKFVAWTKRILWTIACLVIGIIIGLIYFN